MTLLLLAACSNSQPDVDTGLDSAVGHDTAPEHTDLPDTDTDTGTGTDTGPGTDSGSDTATDSGKDTDTGDPPPVPLELCINEFMPGNESSIQDETLAYPDWIELHNPGDAPVALNGWTLTDTREEPHKHTLTGHLTVAPGAFQLLWADDLPELGPNHLGFKIGRGGGEVALYAPDGRGSIVTYGAMADDFSLTRVRDCCLGQGCLTFDYRGTPGFSNVEPVYEDVSLLDAGSVWSYWDRGTTPSTGWESSGYDHSAWASGAGPFGYGDPVVTTVSYGPSDVSKYVTTWFRTSFSTAGLEVTSLAFELLRDDGAIVYLNGVEVLRDNLPLGDITSATLASIAVSGTDETIYSSYAIDLTALVAGTNTIAVGVHQSAANSSDLGFDLAVSAEILVTE